MLKYLEENKKTVIENGRIISSVEIPNWEEPDKFIKFVGVATLKNGDANKVLEASRIAEAKMERKVYKYQRKILREQRKMIDELLKENINEMAKTENRINNCDKHIKDICDRL